MVEHTQLEPCPFCGECYWSQSSLQNIRGVTCGDLAAQIRMKCNHCGALGPISGPTAKDRREAWNTRPTPPTEGLVEEAREIAKRVYDEQYAKQDGAYEEAEGLAEAELCLTAVTAALQTRSSLLAEVRDCWERQTFPRSVAHAGEMADEMDALLAKLPKPERGE